MTDLCTRCGVNPRLVLTPEQLARNAEARARHGIPPRPGQPTICSECLLDAITPTPEEIMAMSDEEVVDELKEEGFDLEAFRARMLETVRRAREGQEP